MDDRLEKFIKDHREELDIKIPRNDLWKEVEKELKDDSEIKSISRSAYMWRAAAVILLVITSWLAYERINQIDSTESRDIVSLSPQLAEAEAFYISLINDKREEIKVLGQRFDLGADFINEIDQLDSMYAVLKKDMQYGNQENLVDAMILNLQLRIEILNQQLSIIKSIENSEKDESIIL